MSQEKHQSTIHPVALKEQDAARHISMSVQFLRQSRCHGNRHTHTPAPPFIKIGRAVLYKVDDLNQWLDENRVEI